jgi:hypothetical protein
MNDIARQLRAQIPSSTDPDRLEQMAREAERRTYRRRIHSRDGESESPGYQEWVKHEASHLEPSCAADAKEESPANEGTWLRGFPGRPTIVRTLARLPHV